MRRTEHDRVSDELLELLARRIAVLEAALAAPRTRPELVADLDVSRSTVDRAVRELEGVGLLEFHDGAYQASLAGRLAYRECAELRGELAGVEAATDLLTAVPHDAPFDVAMLVGADVVRAGGAASRRPGPAIADRVAAADRVRALSRADAAPAAVSALADGVRTGDLRADVVFERGGWQSLAPADALGLAALREQAYLDVHVVDSLPYGLVVAERAGDATACVAVYDDENALRGAVLNDRPAAVAWAEDTFTAVRRRATAP